MKSICLLLFYLSSASLLVAQVQTINTDRPTQSASAFVMPRGGLQVEYGFLWENTDREISSLTIANFLVRWGALDFAEVRITQNVLTLRFEDAENITGLSPLTIGTKIHLAGEKGIIPQMSILGQVTLRTGKEAFRPGKAVAEARLNFHHSLSERFTLGYNLGLGFPEDDLFFLYSAVLNYAVSEGCTAFIEPYGFIFNGLPDHRINAGFIFLLQPRFQLDFSAGLDLSGVSPYFLGFGASYLFL